MVEHRTAKGLILLDFLLLGTNGPMILDQVVCELLIGRLGEDSLLPQVGCQVGVGVGDSCIRSLG